MAKLGAVEVPVNITVKSMIGEFLEDQESKEASLTAIRAAQVSVNLWLHGQTEEAKPIMRLSVLALDLLQKIEDLEDVLVNTQEELAMASAYISDLRAQPGFVEIPDD